jgi:hypothetical protein
LDILEEGKKVWKFGGRRKDWRKEVLGGEESFGFLGGIYSEKILICGIKPRKEKS